MNRLLLDWDKLSSVLKGAIIAGAGAALAYVAGWITSADFGLGPVVGAVLAVLVNYLRKVVLRKVVEPSQPPAPPALFLIVGLAVAGGAMAGSLSHAQEKTAKLTTCPKPKDPCGPTCGCGCLEGGDCDCSQIIRQLGSADWKTRQHATKVIARHLNEHMIRELKHAVKTADLETVMRAERLLQPVYEREARAAVAEEKRKCGGKLPWLSSHYSIPEAEGYASLCAGHLRDGWQGYRDATEVMLLDFARGRRNLAPVVEELKRLELLWIDHNGGSYDPPIKPTW